MSPSDVRWLIGFGILLVLAVAGVLLAAFASRRDWKKITPAPDERESLFPDVE